VRYRFKGLARSTGNPLEGHVEAFSEEDASEVLSENGIISESLREDPVPLPPPISSRQPVRAKGSNTAIDHALDQSSMLVPFDRHLSRHTAKSVWVIDREKILRNVSETVDAAIAQSAAQADSEGATRARVAQAIEGLFGDNRNIATQVNATMERQLLRMERLIVKTEAVLAAVAAAARSGGGGWGGNGGNGDGPRRTHVVETRHEQNAVLLEIFKENLRLRGIELDAPAETGNAHSAAETTSTETTSTQGARTQDESEQTTDLNQ